MLQLDVVYVKQAWTVVLRGIFWRLWIIYVMRRPRIIILLLWTQVDRIILNVFALNLDWSKERLGRLLRLFTKDLKRLLLLSLSFVSSL